MRRRAGAGAAPPGPKRRETNGSLESRCLPRNGSVAHRGRAARGMERTRTRPRERVARSRRGREPLRPASSLDWPCARCPRETVAATEPSQSPGVGRSDLPRDPLPPPSRPILWSGPHRRRRPAYVSPGAPPARPPRPTRERVSKRPRTESRLQSTTVRSGSRRPRTRRSGRPGSGRPHSRRRARLSLEGAPRRYLDGPASATARRGPFVGVTSHTPRRRWPRGTASAQASPRDFRALCDPLSSFPLPL